MRNEEQELDDIKKEMANLTGRLKKLASEAGGAVSESAGNLAKQIPQAVHDYADQANGKIKEGAAAVKDTAVKTAKKADTYARQNPWHVAAIAAGVGAALGGLLGLSRRRKRD